MSSFLLNKLTTEAYLQLTKIHKCRSYSANDSHLPNKNHCMSKCNPVYDLKAKVFSYISTPTSCGGNLYRNMKASKYFQQFGTK